MVTIPTLPDDYYDERDRMNQTTKSEQRTPRLSDDVISTLTSDDQPHSVAYAVRTFYENLITSGELRVVKTVKYDRGGCPYCGNSDDFGNQWPSWKFCPGCGAQILP